MIYGVRQRLMSDRSEKLESRVRTAHQIRLAAGTEARPTEIIMPTGSAAGSGMTSPYLPPSHPCKNIYDKKIRISLIPFNFLPVTISLKLPSCRLGQGTDCGNAGLVRK
jgi:hypothetical protein